MLSYSFFYFLRFAHPAIPNTLLTKTILLSQTETLMTIARHILT